MARSLNVSESRLISRTAYLCVSSGASQISITPYSLLKFSLSVRMVIEEKEKVEHNFKVFDTLKD
jgi:hypothetical protein